MFFKYRKLRNRWIGQENRINAIFEAINNGKDWTIFLSDNDNHKFGSLRYIDDGSISTIPEDHGPRDLRGITVKDTVINDSESLTDTCFDFSTFENVRFENTNLTGASFQKAHFSGDVGVIFRKVKFLHTSFELSVMNDVVFVSSNLNKVIFDGVNANRISFYDNEIKNVSISGPNIFNKKGTKFSNVELDVNFENQLSRYDHRFLTFLGLAQKTDILKQDSRILMVLFHLVTDYRRSYSRLLFAMLLILFFFGTLFSIFPLIDFSKISDQTFFTPYYFSIVTFTTLGYGDIMPLNWAGRLLCGTEAILGYIMLGIFVAMIYEKLSGE
jgi:uncharacterized protein YjbI with pentapeptide repeats